MSQINKIPFKLRNIDAAIAAFNSGKKGEAFKIVGSINIKKITDEEKKILMIAGEMLTTPSSLYQQMGYDKDTMAAKAESVFKERFINNKEK